MKQPLRHHATKLHRAGLSLVEVMVVLAIIAGLVGGSAYMMGALSAGDLKSNAMTLTSSIKYMYSQAAVHNTQYRLVFNMDDGTYEAQVVEEAFVNQPDPSLEEDDGDDARRDEEFLTKEALELGAKKEKEKELYDDREDNPFGFRRSASYRQIQDSVLKPGKLENGAKFSRIIVPNLPEVESGKVALNFFPNGYQEPMIIILEGPSGGKFSLVTEPLTGRVKLYSKEVDIPEDFGQGESDE